jgi:TatD DNase family protein
VLVDSHCHLASHRFGDDLDAVVARAVESGVTRIVAVATELDDSEQTVALAARFPGTVFASVGVHPCDVAGVAGRPDWIDRLRDLASRPGVVAIGETGTDHFHPPPEGMNLDRYRALQRGCFLAQLDLAEETGMPVIVHTRESLPATRELVAPYHGRVRAVFHCFVDSAAAAAPLVEAGHLVSFTGIATFKNATTVHDCVRGVPGGSFMVESDAPFLAPVPHRGGRNEPSYVRHTAEAIAAIRCVSTAALASATTSNAERFFRFGEAARRILQLRPGAGAT